MTPERWRKLEDLFAQALAIPAGRRDAFVEEATDADAEMRRELSSLLANATDSLGEAHAAIETTAADLVSSTRIGSRIGPYRLLTVIGEGGMGTVYRAQRDDNTYVNEVALKLIRTGLQSEAVVRRFRDERQVLAGLKHRGIVQMLDGGTTSDGLPYIVMECVEGVSLAQASGALTLDQRLRLVIEIAAALQYAHQNLVVHRDVKPSNILVDREGNPKLLDFGIAKAMDSAAQREASTRTGGAMFTVEYASPEQLRGDPVTVATDVYSLGAVLYELLVGQPPQRALDSYAATLAQISKRDPARPSVVSTLPWQAKLAGDLDSIVLKALQRDPAERYPSATLLATDLERYLTGLPVSAHHGTLRYRVRKLIARNRWRIVLATLFVAVLATGTIVSIVQAAAARREAEEARRGKRALLRERGLQELRAGHATRSLPYFAEAMNEGDDSGAMRLITEEALAGFSREVRRIPIEEGAVTMARSPIDGSFVVTTMTGRILWFDAGGRLRSERTVEVPMSQDLAISRDGQRVMVRDESGRIFVWSDPSRPEIVFKTTIAAAQRVTLTDDGKTVVATGSDGTVRWFDVETADVTERAIQLSSGATVSASAVMSDGTAVIGTSDGSLDVLSRDRDAPVRIVSKHGAALRIIKLTSPPLLAVTADDNFEVRVTSLGDATEHTLNLTAAITALDLSTNGDQVVTAEGDGAVSAWNVVSGRTTQIIAPMQTGIRSITLGDQLATVGDDSTFRVWTTSGQALATFEGDPGAGTAGHSVPGARLAFFDPGHAQLLTLEARNIRLWRLESDQKLDVDFDVGFPASSAAYSHDEMRVAVAGKSRIALWDVRTRQAVWAVDLPTRLIDVTWSPVADHLVVVGESGVARILDARGNLIRDLVGHRGTVHRGSWSSDGQLIVTAGNDLTARVWDATTGTQRFVLPHPQAVMAASWSRDGQRIVTSCRDRRLRVWDARSGVLLAMLDGHNMQFLDVTFSPDGKRVVAAGRDGNAGIWDVSTGALVTSLEGHTDVVIMAAYSPDGEIVATTADNGFVGLWDPATGALLSMRAQAGEPLSLAWNRASTALLVAGSDGHVRIFRASRTGLTAQDVLDLVAARVPYRLLDARLERVPSR